MKNLSDFPSGFLELQTNPPKGFNLSERIINPIIIIDKAEKNIIARLAGTQVLRGEKNISLPPSNQHAWVVDQTTIRPLPRDAVRIFVKMLQGADPNNLLYHEAVRLLRDSDLDIEVEPSEAFLKSGRVVAEDLDCDISIPGLTATLFPYQARGVQWMCETISQTQGLILADEMGLGKTIQIIALLLLDPPTEKEPALIACPTSLIANWVQEFTKFAPDLTIMIHRGPNRAGIYRSLQKTNIVITTYDTLVNDISIFSSFAWSWVICDEAQAIKNPDSNRRKAVATIPRFRTIPMTGTPVENSLLDLWSLVDFAIPGLLGSRSDFEAKYPDSQESAKALGRLTDPLILKRRVADVAADLPERIDIDIPLELGDELTDHYLQVRSSTLEKYPVAGALVATLQLQLVCAHPWLRNLNEEDTDADDATIVQLKAYELITPKMERTLSLLQEAFINKRKVIIFALFNRVGDLLKRALPESADVFWDAINGSTPQSERQSIIDRFSEHNGPGCLVLNPKAAGSGLNITAATIVIHFTPVWNPALEAQASARAHRRGQTQPVTIYRLFYKDTIEEVMIDRSLWKSELANEITPISSRDSSDIKRALEIAPRKT